MDLPLVLLGTKHLCNLLMATEELPPLPTKKGVHPPQSHITQQAL